MTQEVTIIEALENLGKLIDEAVEKIYIWEDSPEQKQEAVRELIRTRDRINSYLGSTDAKTPSRAERKLAARLRTKSGSTSARGLTTEEQERLLSGLTNVEDQRLKTLVPLILFTGIRP